MNIGHVYIKGQIGSYGEIEGVELQDVVMQIESQKDVDLIKVHITSPGGSVNTGRLIADYISKLPNVQTIAEELCGSIATEIHLSVPLANRKIVAGTEYFIHNPLLEGVSGNADELAEASAFVKVYEKEMLSMYCKATGAGKAAIEGLMKAETSLTDEQAKTLGFVSEVLPRLELKAVAFMNEKIVTKEENKYKNLFNMNVIDEIKKGFANLKAELKNEEVVVKSMMVNTDNGELTYASEGELPEVGEAVMIGEEIAPEGTYTVEGVAVITVDAEGIVTDVATEDVVDVEEEETVEAIKAKMIEMQEAHDAAMAAKDEEFTQTLETEINALKEEIVKAKALVGSDFEPKAEKKVFNKAKAELSPREKMIARKAELKEKKEKK
jgi:ATP-dependent protease ClpP protease subunit